jgi:hypothetical protein
LFQIGWRFRERNAAGGNAPKVLADAINKYVRWSCMDGNLSDQWTPLVIVSPSLRPDELIQDVVDRTEDEMKSIAKRWREMYEAEEALFMPVLYGIIIAKTVMTFVTLDSASDNKAKSIAFFSWKESGQDIWNASAIALLVMQARNVLIDIIPEGLEAPAEKLSSDPDE